MKIRCPECGAEFDLDGRGYAEIAGQVRTAEFEKDVKRETDLIRSAMESEKTAVAADARAEERRAALERERSLLDRVEKSEAEAADLRAKLAAADAEKKLAVAEASSGAEEKSRQQISELSEQLAYYKDFKARMSTKAVGESLEQYCMTEFNRVRMTAFPDAYFEKDNEVSRSGSKGDFIFREERDGVELISIMFDMKNECDTTASKHRNEDFFKELDRDRREKNCEYAVLVSLLEADSDYYNDGIVDVSYRYPKMYVVRPQFFITIISLLRNAAESAFGAKRELAEYRAFNLDVDAFRQSIDDFKSAAKKNYDLAGRHFSVAIEGIDAAIVKLEKVRSELTASERDMRLLNDKAESLSVKLLTKNSPSVREMFGE